MDCSKTKVLLIESNLSDVDGIGEMLDRMRGYLMLNTRPKILKIVDFPMSIS